MQTILRNDCKVKAIVWDNESVLTAPDSNVCYDIAYDKIGIASPLAGDPHEENSIRKCLVCR